MRVCVCVCARARGCLCPVEQTNINLEWFILFISDDPEVPHVQHHRKFLKEHVIFKEV